MRMSCYNCQHIWETDPPLERSASCPQCHNDAKVCRNCEFYDRSAHHECREPEAEWVRDKERSNFCTYFSPRQSGTASEKDKSKDDIQRKLDDLFKTK